MSNIYSLSYDEKFEKLKASGKRLSWYPWIGKDYPELPAQNRILLVGESHYMTEYTENINPIEKDNFTRTIVGSMGVDANKTKTSFYKNTYRLIMGEYAEDKKQRIAFWKKVCFYNFIQKPMADGNSRPMPADLKQGRDNLLDLLQILKPSVCIFLGVTAADQLNETLIGSEYSIEKEVAPSKPIGRNSPRIGRILASDGQVIKLLFVKHPSRYFSPDPWNHFLKKNAPSQMEWIKSLIHKN